MSDFDMSEVAEIEEADFNIGGGRAGGTSAWDMSKIVELAEKLGETSGKCYKFPIAKFYESFRTEGKKEAITHTAHYCRVAMQKALKKANVDGVVKAMGTNENTTEGLLKVKIK